MSKPFEHPCVVCGTPDAPYGYGVNLRTGNKGKWYCPSCRPELSRSDSDARDSRVSGSADQTPADLGGSTIRPGLNPKEQGRLF